MKQGTDDRSAVSNPLVAPAHLQGTFAPAQQTEPVAAY
jgi:hypothetical protein